MPAQFWNPAPFRSPQRPAPPLPGPRLPNPGTYDESARPRPPDPTYREGGPTWSDYLVLGIGVVAIVACLVVLALVT